MAVYFVVDAQLTDLLGVAPEFEFRRRCAERTTGTGDRHARTDCSAATSPAAWPEI